MVRALIARSRLGVPVGSGRSAKVSSLLADSEESLLSSVSTARREDQFRARKIEPKPSWAGGCSQPIPGPDEQIPIQGPSAIPPLTTTRLIRDAGVGRWSRSLTAVSGGRIQHVSVPDIASHHATCAYSWISPPRRSRRTTLPAGTTTGGSPGPSGGSCPRARWGRCTL